MPNFFDKYPYTDFHELNLDWVLQTIKDLVAEWETYHTTLSGEWSDMEEDWQDTKDAWVSLKNYVENYFANLNVQYEVNQKLDQMAADGTLADLVYPFFVQFEEDINTLVMGQNSRIAVLESRMDTFASLTIGSTTGDAELMDARTAIDGIIFPSAGDAIRGQIKYVPGLNTGKLYFVENNDHRLIISNGTVISGAGYITTSIIPLQPRQVIQYDVPPATLMVCCYYKADGTFISAQASKGFFFAPDDTAYCRIGSYATGISSLLDFNFRYFSTEIEKLSDNLNSLKQMNDCRYASGLLRNDVTTQCCTNYMDVSNIESLFIYNTGTTASIFFFDASFGDISNSPIYGPANVPYNKIDIPTTAVYAIISGVAGYDINNSIKFIAASDDIIEIGAGKPYTSILKALKENITAKDFIVFPGTYDIKAEYEAEYLDPTFWDTYTGYVGSFDYFLRGLNLYPGQQIHMRPGVTVSFDYSGTNPNVAAYFSIFNTTCNNNISGGYINFGNMITRYAIHDDAAGSAGVNLFEDITFDGTSGNGPVIGGGCGTFGNRYIVSGCIFKNNAGYTDVMYHNALAANAYNQVIVTNCYGTKGVSFLYCGSSTVINDWIVSNSKFPDVKVVAHPSAPHPYVNINLITYCNDIS